MNIYLPFTERLPSQYQEVEYIQSNTSVQTTAGPYINTGFVPKSTTKVAYKYKPIATNVTYPIYGAWTGYSGNKRFNGRFDNNNGDGGIAFGYGNKGGSGNRIVMGNDIAEVENYVSNGNLYNIVNGITKTESASYDGNTIPLFIFARNGANEFGGGRMYYFKIWDNGTLVRDFIPCYRKQDNVIGLYDLVNSVFYTNAGTGTFSKGNDVMSELKNTYIGDVWTPGSNTIFYYPLENNVNDYSGNNRNGNILTGGLSYLISGGIKKSAFFNRNTIFSIPNIAGTYSTYTFNVWFKPTGTDFWQEMFDNIRSGNTNNVYFNFNGSVSTQEQGSSGRQNFAYQYRPGGGSAGYQTPGGTADLSINTWYNVCVIGNSSGVKLYLNGTKIGEVSTTGTIILNNHGNGQGGAHIGGRYDNNGQYKNYLHGYLSEFIMENKTWTEQEVADYYNKTKSNYGI